MILKKIAHCQLQTDSSVFRFSFLVFLLSFYILNSTFCIAELRYVSKTGTSTPPYTTWETAADSIQKCINNSSFGDTIYVANGVYEEQVVMINGLSLIGAGMDSCIIDTRELITSISTEAVIVADSCLFTGFNIWVYYNWELGRGINANVGNGNNIITNNKITRGSRGITPGLNSTVYSNSFVNISLGVRLFNSNAIIRRNLIYRDPNTQTSLGVIDIEAFDNNYSPIIDSNYIEATSGRGIWKAFGSRPKIKNNVITFTQYGAEAIYLSQSDSSYIYNNLILIGTGISGIYNPGVPYLQIINNHIRGREINSPLGLLIGESNIVKNNIITNTVTGISAGGAQNISVQYNNLWNNNTNYSGFTPDTTNLSVDPMIVNDDTTKGELNFHLQAFSPLIDAGDPNILDRDGSRSDIGLYDGPYGWTYTYMDLAPRTPHNITAVYEDGLVKLTWNKNTEADFSHYRIYRDTLSILIYDSTKIVGETSDTLFYDNIPLSTAKKYYYLVTAFDNQGNQSPPGEEVSVTVTGLTEHPPIGDDGYRLMSNYPNPFNPSTVIPYRLKEAGYVKLYVYDVKGELVKILVNQWQNKGFYEVVFHPNSEERQRANSYEVKVGKTYSDIATGVYIYHLMVKGEGNIPVFSDIGKMILLK